MEKKLTVKTVASAAMAGLFILMILLVSIKPVAASAAVCTFTGIESIEAEEGSRINLLEGVSAVNANGESLPVSVTQVFCDSDAQYSYDGSGEIILGSAGMVYRVEYSASDVNNAEECGTAQREIISIAKKKSETENTESAPEQIEDDQAPTEAAPAENTENPQQENLHPQEDASQDTTAPQDAENPELMTGPITDTGLPIYYKNGLHYIEDPAYPNAKIILYCMNNELKWPHSTMTDPNVPSYSEGYLTPEMFESRAQYEECMRKLERIFHIGYPYNAEHLYQIVQETELHKPTVKEFNKMLVQPQKLEDAFPVLQDQHFTLDDINNAKKQQILKDFLNQVVALYPNGTTGNGLNYLEITSMPFYKAAFCMTFGADDPLEVFANMYAEAYFVTEKQAYDATQFAVWKLLCDYHVPYNNITDISTVPLAEVLLNHAAQGETLKTEPQDNKIQLVGDLSFTYDGEDGKWHSGKLRIKESAPYHGRYRFTLPEGVSLESIQDGYVHANEAFSLVSTRKLNAADQLTITANIPWLREMKQYTPIGDSRFQSMGGAVIQIKQIRISTPCGECENGKLEISKSVEGDAQDQQTEFSFTLRLPDHPIDGVYGDLTFHDGVANFTLKHGETKRAVNLPEDAAYIVEEASNPAYTVITSNARGTITGEESILVSFINQRKGSLSICKEVAGEMGDKTKRFTFHILLHQEDGTPVQESFSYTGSVIADCVGKVEPPENGTISFVNGQAEIALSHGQCVEIQGLPFHCKYKVTEQQANQDGYVTKYITEKTNRTAAAGTVTTQTKVRVVNTKEYIPETGVNNRTAMGILAGISLAVVGLSIPAAGCMVRKRKGSKR